MKKKYSALVIGCGRMGARPSSEVGYAVPNNWLPLSHCESIIKSDNILLTGICDTNAKNLAKAKIEFQVENTFENWKIALDKLKPDILSIATRTPQKAEIILEAIQSGVRGIYVEKPLSFSLHEVTSVLKSVKDAGVSLFYGVNRRYHPTYRLAKQLINEGVIGEIECVHIEHGAAPLFWSHPHSTDLIQFFSNTNKISWTSSAMKKSSYSIDTTSLCVDSDPIILNAIFSLENGIIGSIGLGRGLNTRISGNKGTLTVVSDGSYIELYEGVESGYFTQRSQDFEIPTKPATITAFNELALSIENQSPVSTTHIKTGTEMLISAAWSHFKNGQRVTALEIPKNFSISGRTGSNFA